MSSQVSNVPFHMIRGGTSRCIVIDGQWLSRLDLSEEEVAWQVLRGQTDAVIDGIGGSNAATSKLFFVYNKEQGIEYIFYTLSKSNELEALGNCGNCLSAIGLYDAVTNGPDSSTAHEAMAIHSVTGRPFSVSVLLSREGTLRRDKASTGVATRVWFDSEHLEAALQTVSAWQSVRHDGKIFDLLFVKGETSISIAFSEKRVDKGERPEEWLSLSKSLSSLSPDWLGKPSGVAVVDGKNASTTELRTSGNVKLTARFFKNGTMHSAFPVTAAVTLVYSLLRDDKARLETIPLVAANGPPPSTVELLHPSGVMRIALDYDPVTDAIARLGVEGSARWIASGSVAIYRGPLRSRRAQK